MSNPTQDIYLLTAIDMQSPESAALVLSTLLNQISDRLDKLEAQSAVARWVRDALTNGELEEAADTIEVGVDS